MRPKETSTRRIMIAGGGNIGYRLAKQLEHAYNVKIIECRPRRAEWIAENLDNTLVLQGSATDETLLDNEYIDEIDVFCALTNDDESNIMSALLAKNLGAKRVIGIVNRSSYVDLLEGNKSTSSSPPPHHHRLDTRPHPARRHRCRPPHPARHGGSHRSRRARRQKTSAIIGRRISGIKWPEGCHIAAVVRAGTGETIMGHHTETVIQDGDHIIFFVSRRRILNELEKLIQVKMGFFG
ncbi:potassium transporter peripheral membrane protein [Neisseria gonorrhoeae]|uniref:Potassium transporter peripheral membrane protein n=1 Tax=Neisseria gonorrhoeae TaxID=485 RepID=A0A378VW78_NEIGO|nr:potassium transporter peripheral membrane protein [Neisseria gonorrhoeae]